MAISIQGFGGGGKTWALDDLDGAGMNFVYTVHQLVFSGNYATGGDTLDFTAIMGNIPSHRVPLTIGIEALGTAAVPSLTAAGGFYQPIVAAVAAPSTYKLKIFGNTAGSVAEYSAGAYGTDVLGDIVIMRVLWRKY
jgi:hypothetical protein